MRSLTQLIRLPNPNDAVLNPKNGVTQPQQCGHKPQIWGYPTPTMRSSTPKIRLPNPNDAVMNPNEWHKNSQPKEAGYSMRWTHQSLCRSCNCIGAVKKLRQFFLKCSNPGLVFVGQVTDVRVLANENEPGVTTIKEELAQFFNRTNTVATPA